MGKNLEGNVATELRRLQTLIRIFNESQSSLIYILKIFVMSTAIAMSFFGILYISSNYFVGTFNLLVGLYSQLTFIALYDNAFCIPIRADYIRRMALLCKTSSSTPMLGNMGAVRRELESFPMLGVKVGHFCYLERQSTPMFMDFVASRTGSLLFTFR